MPGDWLNQSRDGIEEKKVKSRKAHLTETAVQIEHFSTKEVPMDQKQSFRCQGFSGALETIKPSQSIIITIIDQQADQPKNSALARMDEWASSLNFHHPAFRRPIGALAPGSLCSPLYATR